MLNKKTGRVVKALKKAWRTRDGRLVECGNPDAVVLFARKGQAFHESELASIENAAEYFDGLTETPQEKPEPEKGQRRKKSAE